MASHAPARLQGIGASQGVAIGNACLFFGAQRSRHRFRYVGPEQVEAEIDRLEAAVGRAKEELEGIRQDAASCLGSDHLYILDVGMLLLKDEMLIGEARRRIREEGTSAEWALQAASDHFAQMLRTSGDPYMRDRYFDIVHAGERILRHLESHRESLPPGCFAEPAIIVARDLTPADVVTLSREQVLGLVTELGGRTSHTAIMAEAMGIPAVVGAGHATRRVSTGDRLIVDGGSGLVIVNPSAEEVSAYEGGVRLRPAAPPDGEAPPPAETLDGVRIGVFANIEHDQEIDILEHMHLDGVGLFRSEFLYYNRFDLPREEDHYRLYRRLAEAVRPREVVIRTLDLGADRQIPALASRLEEQEPNPALGLRALRFALREPAILKCQLRAILRASAHGNLALMYPMVSGLEEIRAVRALLEEARAELRAEGAPFDAELRQGVLVETPAAALCADILAREVDFLSVGSNDLTQYTLAVDRLNERVAAYYEPFHPALLRLLDMLVKAARTAEVPISVCGELASDPEGALCLVGLGFRSLSMAISKVGAVRRAIRASRAEDLGRLASALLRCATAEEVRENMKRAGWGVGPNRSAVRPAV